jgi:hypothetical protein
VFRGETAVVGKPFSSFLSLRFVVLAYWAVLHTFILTGESILVFARLLQDATFITQKSAITPKRESVGAG